MIRTRTRRGLSRRRREWNVERLSFVAIQNVFCPCGGSFWKLFECGRRSVILVARRQYQPERETERRHQSRGLLVATLGGLRRGIRLKARPSYRV